MSRATRRLVAPVIGLVTFLALWEGFVRVFHVRKTLLRPPSTALRYLWNFRGDYLAAAWVTIQHAALGLLFALIAAVVVGAILASSRFLEEAAQPVLTLIQVTPWFAYAGSVYVWLQHPNPTALFVVSLVCFPAFTFAAVAGMRDVEPSTLELLASVDAGRWEVLRRVRLPSALPSLFTTARFNFGLSLAAAYYEESANFGTEGLGRIASRAALSRFGPDMVWAAVFCVAFLGALGLLAISWLQRIVLHWHASHRAQPG